MNVFIVSVPKYATSKWMSRIFCLPSNLSNDNISSAERPGLKTGSGFQWCGLKTGVENDIFWSEIGSGFGEPGGTPPIKISQEYPRAQI